MTYKIEPADKTRAGQMTGEADDLHSALGAAWQLNRHFEADIDIIDEDDNRIVATVKVEWSE